MAVNPVLKRRILIVSLVIGILLFLSIIITALTSALNPTTPQVATTPTPTDTSTPTPTTSSPLIQFAGFNSNLTLSNESFLNSNIVSIKSQSMPVYYATWLSQNTIQAKIPSIYSTRISKDVVYIDNSQSDVPGTTSAGSVATSIKNYCTTVLGLDTSIYSITATLTGKDYKITGVVQLNGVPLFNLDGTSQIMGSVSTSGQLLHLEFHRAFSSIKVLNATQVSTPSLNTLSAGDIGIYLTDILPTESVSSIQNDPITIQTATTGYYFDWQTGFVFPVVKMTSLVSLQSSSKTFHINVLAPIIDPNTLQQFIPSVTPTPTMNPAFAYD